jgi:hypothetical protein
VNPHPRPPLRAGGLLTGGGARFTDSDATGGTFVTRVLCCVEGFGGGAVFRVSALDSDSAVELAVAVLFERRTATSALTVPVVADVEACLTFFPAFRGIGAGKRRPLARAKRYSSRVLHC